MIDSYLQMQSVSKSFGSVKALEAVNLKVEKGSIHALVGENGAGKTTLMRVLYGAIRPDTGTILLDGEVREFRSSKQAIRAGIGMVTQHYSVIPDLTCLQNLILGAEPGLWMALGAARDRAQLLTGQMGFSFDWDRPAAELSPAASQKLEILKLLWRNSRVMILDEPTAMLPPSDGELLYQSLKQLVANGATVVVVTHRLPEVLDHCDHVTVLRGGCLVASKPVSETSSTELAELIVGHSLGEVQRGSPPREGSIMLDLEELVVLGDRGNEALKGINLKVEKGEVVGVAGVDGSGQRELCNFVAGTTFAKSGLGQIDGRALGNDGPATRIDLGLRVIPEDRLSEGIIEDWSLLDNAVLGYQRTAEFSESGWLRADAGRLFATQFAERFQTKHGGLEMPMKSLSGGNQQRFVAARALGLSPKMILAFQPARGLDIDATRNLYDAIRSECRSGAAALVVSFDLDELIENCDRIVVMNNGKLFIPDPGKSLDRAHIGELMVGTQ